MCSAGCLHVVLASKVLDLILGDFSVPGPVNHFLKDWVLCTASLPPKRL